MNWCRLPMLSIALWTVASTSVRAEEPKEATSRGALTGLGMVLLVGGFTSVGVGIGGLINTADTNRRLAPYASAEPTKEQALGVNTLLASREAGTQMALWGFIGGAAAFAGSLVCLLLDMPKSAPILSVAPHTRGASLVFSLGF